MASTARSVGFWSGYWKSLKPRSVEEPIDVWVHRPVAYVLAKALLPTPVSPNVVTLVSILFALAAGVLFALATPAEVRLGGLCLFFSAVFDCADGQLARMRGTSSPFGRMLDGAADLVGISAAVGGAAWVLFTKFPDPWWARWVVLGLAVATAVTGSFHTSMYDHYKNVYLRLTTDGHSEAEDYESAVERHAARDPAQMGLAARIAWPIYLFYVRSQTEYTASFDPWSSARLALYPPFDAERARIYERHAGRLMKAWRTWFGFGSLVFGIAVSAVFDVFEWYMGFRLVVMNAAFYGYLRPAQRRASREAFREMGLALPGAAPP